MLGDPIYSPDNPKYHSTLIGVCGVTDTVAAEHVHRMRTGYSGGAENECVSHDSPWSSW